MNKLENLKEKMNKTVLKDMNFENKHKENVWNSIHHSKVAKERFRPKKLTSLVAVVVTVIFFTGTVYYTSTQESEDQAIDELFNRGTNDQEIETKVLIEEINTPQKQEEYFEDMSKEEILTKMINSIDHFETAKGSFEYNSNGNKMEVEYGISLNENDGGYSKVTTFNNEEKVNSSTYYKDGTKWEIDENSSTYWEFIYSEMHRSNQLTLEKAFGDNVTIHRERPPIGLANSSLFPYEIASNYTRDLNTWEIEKQNEELLGHNTLVIKGNVNKYDFRSFRFWVDKDTGILVKYETYNDKGEIVDYLYSTKLEVNVPIDSDNFVPNLEGMEQKTFANSPSIITGNIDDEIPDDLKSDWEEAKRKPNETTILQKDNEWYIYTEKGYVEDYIETNGDEGILYLTKVTGQKAEHNFHALLRGYDISTLEIVK